MGAKAKARTGIIQIKDLRARAEILKLAVVVDKLATADELHAAEPGGPKNRDTGVWGWFHYVNMLHRFLERRSVQHQDREAKELAMLDVLRSEPEAVELVTPIGDIRVLTVYPKSADAMIELAKVDHDIEWVYVRAELLRDDGSADARALYGRCLEKISHDQAVMAWVMCEGTEESKAAVPYADEQRRAPEPPVLYRALDVFDYSRVCSASMRVNRDRLALAYQLLPILARQAMSKGNKRPRMADFLGQSANELGIDPNTLTKKWDYGRAVMQSATAIAARLEAQEAAERERKMHPRGRG